MCSSIHDGIVAAYDVLDAALDRVLELDCTALSDHESLALLRRCERLRRRLPAAEHPLVNQIAAADAEAIGGKPRWVLADELRITRADAGRRIAEAAELGPRRSITGEPLPPLRPEIAAAQRQGRIGGDHIAVIRSFFAYLPDDIDAGTLTQAEQQLSELAGQFRPEQVSALAQRLADYLHPDGNLTDEQRATRRGLVVGPQGPDGMSRVTGYLDPQARATWDAVLACWASPGMCNPDDPAPCTGGTPTQAQIDADTRSGPQRNHDALTALGRAQLASGDLGQHNGLPAAITVSTTLADLEAAAGKAHTGGGTWLSMRDVIAMASHAHHYLRIYDGAKELALFHCKRLANPGQRIVLYAKERGCSHPGCPIPAYLCEVHHVSDYATTRRTDIDELTLRCGPHHQLLTSGGWKTRKRRDGITETLAPPHLDHRRARINNFHHPEKLLSDNHSRDENAP